MDISEKAAQKLKDNLLHRFSNFGVGFRIAKVDSKNVQPTLDIKVDRKQPGDKIIDSYGIRIFIDPSTATTLENSELDLDENNDTLYIRNPMKKGYKK